VTPHQGTKKAHDVSDGLPHTSAQERELAALNDQYGVDRFGMVGDHLHVTTEDGRNYEILPDGFRCAL
jgi:hypothetical protein